MNATEIVTIETGVRNFVLVDAISPTQIIPAASKQAIALSGSRIRRPNRMLSAEVNPLISYVNRDISYAIGFTSDDIFAGNFSDGVAVTFTP